MRSLSRPKSGYLPTLDGWRALAIGLVFFNHASFVPHFKLLKILHDYGELGVDVFFAISGLLICSRLLEEERANGRISLCGFYIRRSFRIFPAAYTYLLVLAGLAIFRFVPMDWPAWSSALVFLRNYFTCFVRDTAVNRFTGHFWSLAIEEHFYLLLPSLLVLFPRRRKLVLGVLTVLAFAWLVVYLHITPSPQRSIFWERRTDLHIASLLFPAWLALYLPSERARARLAKCLQPKFVVLLLALALLTHFIKKHAFPGHPVVPQTVNAPLNPETFVIPRGGSASWMNFVIPILFPFLILATMLNPGSWFSRPLEWLPFRFVGRISYSLYLWQQLFWVHPYHRWPIGCVETPVIGMALALSAALASYFFIEKPLIRLGHRLAPPATPGHRDLAASS